MTADRTSEQELRAELERAGARFKGRSCTCPFHEDRNPSAGIHADESGVWRFKCHTPTCGVSGDIFDIRARLEGVDVNDLLKGSEPKPVKPVRVIPTIDAIRESVGRLGTVEDVYPYTHPNTGNADVVQIRWIPKGENRKQFLTHRAVPGGFVLGAGPKPWPIFNRKRVRDSDIVVVVEGEKCVKALHSLGIVATTSLSGAGNAQHADWAPLAGKTVYIMPDNDADGARYATDVATQLQGLDPPPRVFRYQWNEGTAPKYDVADLIAGYPELTAEMIWTLIRTGSRAVGIELDERIEETIRGDYRELDFPKFPGLSRLTLALLPSTITVVCGDPGATKSLLLLRWCYDWHHQGTKVALLEMEDDRPFHLTRLLATAAGRWDILNPAWVRENPSKAREMSAEHRDAIASFTPRLTPGQHGTWTYANILGWMENQCKAGTQIIVIDPITSAQVSDNRHVDDAHFISKAHSLVAQYGARLILVTHPRSSGKSKATQDDLAGGRAFSRHVQTILWLHTENDKRFTCQTRIGNMPVTCNRSIFIAKSRSGYGHGAKIGMNLTSEVQFVEEGPIVPDEDDDE